MIKVYHLGVSQSDRIVWLLEELAIPYQLEWFDRGEDGLAPPEYRALHPVGTAPIILDGDTVLAESTAIVEYISQRHGGGRLSVQPDQSNYPDYLYWMQFNNNVQAMFFAKMALSKAGVDSEDNFTASFVQRREDAYYNHLSQRLGQCDYLAGDQFTFADIMSFFNLATLPLFGARSIENLPNVPEYVERISKRPAYIKAMSIAGPSARRP